MMATLIPPLNKQTLSRMTSGEKRFARRLEALLEDDYLCWYDIPVGRNRRYPDFIILHPARGLLCLEVKDWKLENMKEITPANVSFITEKTLQNPLEQARQYTYEVTKKLESEPALLQTSKAYKGKLVMPWASGAVFTNITHKQMAKSIPDSERESVLPDRLIIYKDEMTEAADAEVFQARLWNMFDYQFGEKLTLPQIDLIRWHLFPEIRIGGGQQFDLFTEEEESKPKDLKATLPDIVNIMDIQQEILARSMGEGHRVIHGVAGSGKTLILGYRCLHLAQTLNKPILVLCFNVTLAARLRVFINAKGIGNQVQVYHFHKWCSQQLETNHIEVIESDKPYWERQVDSVIQAVEQGHIPRAQYGALLIDEGHDFHAEWLQLVVQMVDPETNSLLLLYDDAQSIYTKHASLGFSLSSVGIHAQGRTTVLKLNYRNTREILDFAYRFMQHYVDPKARKESSIPLIEPESAGVSGSTPTIRQFKSLSDEIAFTIDCMRQWHEQGLPWSEMAILYPKLEQGRAINKALKNTEIPYGWLAKTDYKAEYDPNNDQVTVLTIHSSKGLEFRNVVILGLGELDSGPVQNNARVLYVGMTRARKNLLLTTSAENEISRQMFAVAAA